MLLGILTILSASSCGNNRPKFDPDAYRANHKIEAIVNERAQVVYAYEKEFSEYACMHKSKWTELRQFVQLLRIPQGQKDLLIKNFEFVGSDDQ